MRPRYVLIFLTAVNILNYIDRGIIPGSTNEFTDFIIASGIDHDQSVYLGLLQSAFIVGFAIASVVFGHLVHYYSTFTVCAMGMSIWVAAVTLCGVSNYAGSYSLLIIARMLSGVGEASIQCSIPPWILKHASSEERTVWLAIFFTAIPVGTALGYTYSAAISAGIGWPYTYFIEGILMSISIPIFMRLSAEYPLQKEADCIVGSSIDGTVAIHETPSMKDELKAIAVKPVYVSAVLGQAAMTGSLIGVSTFGSALLMGLGYFDTETAASSVFGGLVCFAGVVGTPLGGYASDWLVKRRKEADGLSMLASADEKYKNEIGLEETLKLISVATFVGVLLLCVSSVEQNRTLFLMTIVMGCASIFFCFPGINMAVMLSVPEKNRSFAAGVASLVMHALGDVPSPVLAGLIKDSLAPGCEASADDDGDEVATSAACRHDAHGQRMTILIVSAWGFLAVLGFVIARRIALQEHKLPQQRKALLHMDDDDTIAIPIEPFDKLDKPRQLPGSDSNGHAYGKLATCEDQAEAVDRTMSCTPDSQRGSAAIV